ncbi:MAG: hypothetical protein K6T78_00160 [Alicyclobacillus sp.]|nr:hypothetical protein [Alicyclobacillus sp.]
MASPKPNDSDSREKNFVDIDRMINEGLGGGQVTMDNGLIEHSTDHTLQFPESALDNTTKARKDD